MVIDVLQVKQLGTGKSLRFLCFLCFLCSLLCLLFLPSYGSSHTAFFWWHVRSESFLLLVRSERCENNAEFGTCTDHWADTAAHASLSSLRHADEHENEDGMDDAVGATTMATMTVGTGGLNGGLID